MGRDEVVVVMGGCCCKVKGLKRGGSAADREFQVLKSLAACDNLLRFSFQVQYAGSSQQRQPRPLQSQYSSKAIAKMVEKVYVTYNEVKHTTSHLAVPVAFASAMDITL